MGEAWQAAFIKVVAAPTNPKRTNWRRVKGIDSLSISFSPHK
jgi:hypothetical protein